MDKNKQNGIKKILGNETNINSSTPNSNAHRGDNSNDTVISHPSHNNKNNQPKHNAPRKNSKPKNHKATKRVKSHTKPRKVHLNDVGTLPSSCNLNLDTISSLKALKAILGSDNLSDVVDTLLKNELPKLLNKGNKASYKAIKDAYKLTRANKLKKHYQKFVENNK